MNMESTTEPNEDANETKAKQTRTPRARVYTKYVLPSERHPFSLQFDVLRRFISLSRNGAEPVSASGVEGEGIPVQAASRNVRFMRYIGLLTVGGRGLYIPTPDAIKFVNAMSVSDEGARPILRGLLADTWFTELAQSLLSQRPVMSEDQFMGELALAAETDRAKKGEALRVIIDYLVYAGILKRDEQGLSLTEAAPPSAATPAGKAPPETATTAAAAPAAMATTEGDWHIVQTEDFYVKVRSDPDAFEDLSDHMELLKRKMWRLHKGKALKMDDFEEEKEDQASNMDSAEKE